MGKKDHKLIKIAKYVNPFLKSNVYVINDNNPSVLFLLAI